MTKGDKSKLFIVFVPLFTLSLSAQQDCVLPVGKLPNQIARLAAIAGKTCFSQPDNLEGKYAK